MTARMCRQLLVFATLLLCLGGSTLASEDQPVTRIVNTKTLERDVEPVIVRGASVDAFSGIPVNQLILYTYTGSTWLQIPAQVDEVTAGGSYALIEDGLLDANDEIVFMAKDLGSQAPADSALPAVLPIDLRWYEIEVSDPTSPAGKGWAYLVRSRVLDPTSPDDYVDFDPAAHRINGENYSLGFATPDPWADYLTLGGSGVDILDRTKMRLACKVPFICPITEEEGAELQDDLVKDGPVRVIVRSGRVLAYGTVASWVTVIDIPELLAGDIRFSTDFSSMVSGAVYYNAAVPMGVTADGIPDAVAEEPLSPWWQLSTAAGTLVYAADTTPIGGTQSNYYVDDATVDASDTGDQRHYGDTGVSIQGPNLEFSYTFALYVLPGVQPNQGETYAAYLAQPLSVSTQLMRLDLPLKLYLPRIHR